MNEPGYFDYLVRFQRLDRRGLFEEIDRIDQNLTPVVTGHALTDGKPTQPYASVAVQLMVLRDLLENKTKVK